MAIAAYRRALAVDSSDEDATRHLAYLLRRVGNEEATLEFARLFALSGNREDLARLCSINHGSRIVHTWDPFTARTVDTEMVFLELDDLFGYLEAHTTVSGIQRVQVEVARHVLGSSSEAAAHFAFVLNSGNDDCLWCLQSTDLDAIVRYLSVDDVKHGELIRLIATARRSALCVIPGQGQAYVILGAFWGNGAVATRYVWLKKLGVSVGVYVYDIIPITHDEFCDARLSHEFLLSFADGLRIFDFVMTISDFTASEVRGFLHRHGLRSKPVYVVPLAHSIGAPPVEFKQQWTPRIAPLRQRPFALMVSTIEARKNHTYLVSAWKAFLDEGLDPPDLVFVGRPGWRVASLMEWLEASKNLSGRVKLLHGLSDLELSTLYDSCLFTVFPSFVEGWGLPVGEGLAHGKPCVASGTSSIPEVGGDLVDYLDPLNLRDGIEVLRRMAFDVPYRQQRELDVRSRLRARTWTDVATDLLAQINRLHRSLVVDTQTEVEFASGSVFRPSSLAFGNPLPLDYARYPTRSMLVRSWFGVEAIGCWMRDKEGALTFQSDLESGVTVAVYLRLHAPHYAATGNRVAAVIGKAATGHENWGDQQAVVVPVGPTFTICAVGLVDERGIVNVTLRLWGSVEAHGSDTRRFAIGLVAVAYAAASDLEKRLALVENWLVHAVSR